MLTIIGLCFENPTGSYVSEPWMRSNQHSIRMQYPDTEYIYILRHKPTYTYIRSIVMYILPFHGNANVYPVHSSRKNEFGILNIFATYSLQGAFLWKFDL